ncbi:MAG: AI-2E family transporter [Candidatus Kerfeldbacteria bacterium]|nr:AI-2E family transporter [Candidatus Kerfeldbacteria bacterium]
MLPANQTRSLDISFAALWKIVLVGLLVYLAYLIVDILTILLVAIILATAIDPWVDWMQRYKLPRSLSLVIIYLLLFLFIAVIAVVMIPPLASQVADLAKTLPYYYEKIMLGVTNIGGTGFQDEVSVTVQQALQSLGSGLASATGSILASIASVFGGIMQFIITLVIAFYLVVDENGLKRFIVSVTPMEKQSYVEGLLERIQIKLGAWLRGQLLLMLIIGVMTYIGLLLFDMPYALVLALWAGLTEIIPYIGPILGAIPAVLLAASISPLHALLIIGLYVLIQQSENNIIVPAVMKRAVGLNPVISILAVMTGYNIAGVVGAVMAIPSAAIIGMILSDLFDKRWRREDKAV